MYNDYELSKLSNALASESRRNETFQRIRQDQLDARERERQWREKEENDARLKRQQQQQQQQQQQLLQQQYDAWPGMCMSLASPYDSYTADLPPVQQTRTRVPVAGPAYAYAPAHASRHVIIPPPMPRVCRIGVRFCAMRDCIRDVLGINLPDHSTCDVGIVGHGKIGSLRYGREVCKIVINENFFNPTNQTKLINTTPAKINGAIAYRIMQWDVQYTHREEDPDVIQCICDLAASHFAGPDYVSDDRCDNYRAINASTTKRMRINLLLQNYPALPAPQF
jgi:hypothetical protein